MALPAIHALLVHMENVVERDRLFQFFLHKSGQNRPAQNQGHDQAHKEGAPTATATFFCRFRCAGVIPLLHPDASCWFEVTD